MPPKRRYFQMLALGAASLTLSTGSAAAHPMGNFSINHASHLQVGRGGIEVHYILDLAEIPTWLELSKAGKPGEPLSDADRSAYLNSIVPRLRDGLLLTLDRKPAPLEIKKTNLDLRQGAGGLQTLRITLDLSAPIAGTRPGSVCHVGYRDTNYAERSGWKEITATASPGASLGHSSVSSSSLSDELTRDPNLPSAAIPQQSEASFTIVPAPVPALSPSPAPKVIQPGRAAPLPPQPSRTPPAILASGPGGAPAIVRDTLPPGPSVTTPRREFPPRVLRPMAAPPLGPALAPIQRQPIAPVTGPARALSPNVLMAPGRRPDAGASRAPSIHSSPEPPGGATHPPVTSHHRFEGAAPVAPISRPDASTSSLSASGDAVRERGISLGLTVGFILLSILLVVASRAARSHQP